MSGTARLRMLAGPNGSGKSTIKQKIPSRLISTFINPDEIEERMKFDGALSLSDYGVTSNAADVLAFFRRSPLLRNAGLAAAVERLKFEQHRLITRGVAMNSYIASVAAGFLRDALLGAGLSFTFETVMSSRDKIAALKKAQSRGYRTYLYYIATRDPLINVSRVANRVSQGGHDVPRNKIVSRYRRLLGLLHLAIRHSNRAYIWDNSGAEPVLLAEVDEGTLELKTDAVPAWFHESVLAKLG